MKFMKFTARESNMCLDVVATLGVLCVSLYFTSPPDVPFMVSSSSPPQAGR